MVMSVRSAEKVASQRKMEIGWVGGGTKDSCVGEHGTEGVACAVITIAADEGSRKLGALNTAVDEG